MMTMRNEKADRLARIGREMESKTMEGMLDNTDNYITGRQQTAGDKYISAH